MKKNLLLSAVLSLFLLVPASITWAQTISSQKGLTTVVFNVQQGNIKIYLPDDIRPGDIISGSVVAEPAGKNEKQTGTNLTALLNYSFSINDTKFPVDNSGKPFQLTIPEGRPTPCLVTLINAANAAATTVKIPSIPEKEEPVTDTECIVPTHALTGVPLPIKGSFDGNSSNTQCSINNNPLDILAESPRQCIVSFPADAAGPHTISTGENGNPACSKQITGIDLSIRAGKLNLMRGEKTYIAVRISHLENLPDTAFLTLTNTSTDVITMTGGNIITVPVPPPADNASTTFDRQFDVQSIKTGGFTVNANLSLPETVSNPAPVATTLQPPPVKNAKLRLPVSGGDISIGYNGQQVETKENETEHIHVMGNTIRIFLNGVFENEFDLVNAGEATVQDILTQYSNADYPAPDIGCDSLSRICNKNAAFNVFWGDVYSVFEGRATSKLVKGETHETGSQNSLLITRGWEIDCCTGEFKLKLFFQALQGSGGPGSYNISFSKVLKTGKPCPVNCPACSRKCDEMKRLMEEARKKMEEIKKKERGN